MPAPSPAPGFNPGGDGARVIRTIDGHAPWAKDAEEGRNTHTFSSDDPFPAGDPIGFPVDEV